MTPTELLQNVLDQETKRLRTSFQNDDVVLGLVEIIRSLDYHTFTLAPGIRPEDPMLLEKYRMGWSLPFTELYKDLKLGDVPMFPTDKSIYEWADSVIQHGSTIQLCNQFLIYVKADLAELIEATNNTFTFRYLVKETVEHFERLSLLHYHSMIETVLAEKIESFKTRLPEVRKSLRNIVNVFNEHFISYVATPDIDEFYTRFAYLYMMTTQTVDEFDEEDMFGGYPYRNYIDIAQFIIKAALTHRDCCMALAEKTSHKIYLRNILTYGFSVDSFIAIYSKHLGWPQEKLRQIMYCFVITKENISYHLNHPRANAAPYFELNEGIVIRSTFGCLDRPIFFLNKELKRLYPKDYFNAVNNREKRFKAELYSLFNENTTVKIEQNVKIQTEKGLTDLDGIVYDSQEGILALFQLKWQDSFYASLKERFSRITNLIPKSAEWIDKVQDWLNNSTTDSILSQLQLKQHGTQINKVFLFVIARHHIHFTNQHLDERATWASWYQVLEATTKLPSNKELSSIENFQRKLQLYHPSSRRYFDGSSSSIESSSFKFAQYTLNILKNEEMGSSGNDIKSRQRSE